MIPAWTLLPIGLAGFALGVMVTGGLIGKFLDLLIDGIAINMLDEFERRRTQRLTFDEFMASTEAAPVNPAPQAPQDPVSKGA